MYFFLIQGFSIPLIDKEDVQMRGVFDHLTMVRVCNRCIVLRRDGGDITRCAIRRIAALALQTLVSILTFKVIDLTLDGQYLGEIIQLVDTHFDCGQEKKNTNRRFLCNGDGDVVGQIRGLGGLDLESRNDDVHG